jgi:hypothetical protein
MCVGIVQRAWILIAGLFLWLQDGGVNGTVVYSASRFLLFVIS